MNRQQATTTCKHPILYTFLKSSPMFLNPVGPRLLPIGQGYAPPRIPARVRPAEADTLGTYRGKQSNRYVGQVPQPRSQEETTAHTEGQKTGREATGQPTASRPTNIPSNQIPHQRRRKGRILSFHSQADWRCHATSHNMFLRYLPLHDLKTTAPSSQNEHKKHTHTHTHAFAHATPAQQPIPIAS